MHTKDNHGWNEPAVQITCEECSQHAWWLAARLLAYEQGKAWSYCDICSRFTYHSQKEAK